MFAWGRAGFLVVSLPLIIRLMGRDAMGLLRSPVPKRPAWEPLLFVVGLLVLRIGWELYRPSVGESLSRETFRAYVLIAPLNEELLFRALVLGVLLRWDRLPAVPAIAISSLAFAGIHGEYQRVMALTGGGLAGVAYVRSGGILLPLVLHMLWNSFVFVDWRALLRG